MPPLPGDEPRDGSDAFSLVRGDRPFRIQRALGLIPPGGGLGVGRRALLLALLTWGPVAAWAYLTGRALPGRVAEPLFEHFGVHVRCLLAIPLLIVAEATVHAMSTELVPYFVSSDSCRPTSALGSRRRCGGRETSETDPSPGRSSPGPGSAGSSPARPRAGRPRSTRAARGHRGQ